MVWWAKTLPKEESGTAQPITERITVSASTLCDIRVALTAAV